MVTGANTPENVPNVRVLDSSENVPNSTYPDPPLDEYFWALPSILFIKLVGLDTRGDLSGTSILFVEPSDGANIFSFEKYTNPQ